MAEHVHRFRRNRAVKAAVAALVLGLAGCSVVKEAQDMNLPFVTPEGQQMTGPDAATANAHYAAYPASLPIGEPIEIEVIRSGHGIELDNRSVYAYGQAQLWLNHEYGAQVSTVPIGRSGPLSLKNFRNGYGEVYPLGTFLRPERDKKLVMADLVYDGQIHKLTVRLNPGWRNP